MKKVTPEAVGISSENILKYLKLLEENRVVMHDILIMRGEKILFEKYYAPFDKNFLHRQYSVSKSIVSIAVGFAEQDGLLSLDDPIAKYFPEETANITDENVLGQTIRHMLMMSTAKSERYWFNDHPSDRVKYYFENPLPSRPSGLMYEYDSSGSFVLCAMVERLCKKPFTEYLREKLFAHIGVSDGFCCLKCPGGHSWGDSGVLCTPRDLALIARFLMNGGVWNGKRLLNEEYVRLAVSKRIDNDVFGYTTKCSFGYGYLIWRSWDDSFMFNGMGGQYVIAVPDKDLIFVCNGDNQGCDSRKDVAVNGFFEYIARTASDEPLCEDRRAYDELCDYADRLKLACQKGECSSEFAEKVNGRMYELCDNPMGITRFSLSFDENGKTGELFYTNAQGDKRLSFGICENEITDFPQEGYSDKVGNTFAPGHYYRCACSAAWTQPNKFVIKPQIIDEYFGNALFIFAFYEDGRTALSMDSNAEDFLKEYVGFASGKAVDLA